jgi:hypothetical protein
MSCLHLLFVVTFVTVSRHADCTEEVGQSCAQEEARADDLSVLLQHGVASVESASVPLRFASKHGAASIESSSVLQGAHKQTSQLESAAGMLSDILLGKISKSEVEIVLAHYDEEITWSDAYKSVRTIYCKGPPNKRPHGCHHLENVGREGHTYLHHIVHNYDRLSKWTVFTQAQAPTQGYRGHRRGGGHALPGVPFDAYVLPEAAGGLPRDDGSAFVFTGAVHMPTLNHSLRLSFIHATSALELHSQGTCPKTELLDGWQPWWNLGWFKKYSGGKCSVPATDVAKAFNDYWDSNVKLPRPKHDIMFFTQGARFAASRERIHQRPKEFYEELLHKLDKEADPCHNYFNEWIWFYIIGKPEVEACNVDLVIDEANRKKKDEQQMLFEENERYAAGRFNDNDVMSPKESEGILEVDRDVADVDANFQEDRA